MSKNLQITAAQMKVFLSNGKSIDIDVSTMMLKAFADSCGIAVHDVGGGKLAVYRFDDKTIEKNILPLLPKIR